MRLTLLSKIFLALLVVGIVPLGIASFRLLTVNRAAMTEQVLRTHAVAAQTIAGRVDAFVTARREVARGVAANPDLESHPRSPGSTRALAELLHSPLGIVAVSVRNREGDEVVRAQRKEWAEPVETLLQARQASGAILRTAGAPKGAALLRLAVPLARGGGFLVLVCDLEPLSHDLRPRELGDLAEVALVDTQGTLLLGGAAPQSFPPSMIRAALSGKISGSGRFADDGTGDGRSAAAVLGAYAPTAEGWTVLSRQPAAVAEATVLQLRQRGLVAIGVAAVLTLLMAAAAHRTVVRPIRSLIADHRRLAGLGQEATGGSEIAQLRESFRRLERRLREKDALDEVFLGRYQVLEVVGEGAMGTVFRGWDPTLERPVALKTVRFDTPEREEQSRRLLQEAVAVARFNHPNIVGIYDVQEAPDVAFLSMEFIDGQCLEDYLEGRTMLPAAEVVSLGLGIARGLAAAHDRAILHRDIKPANVLLGREGEIKIADFGISEIMTSVGPDPGMVFGTPGFIAPETLLGEGYSPAGDLFALGATLYRLLTGCLPFRGKTVAEVVQNTLSEPLLRPGARVEGIPSALDQLIVDLLSKEPRDRPSAEVVVLRLEEMAESLGEGTPRDGWGHRSATTTDEGARTGTLPTAAGVDSDTLHEATGVMTLTRVMPTAGAPRVAAPAV